MRNLTESFCSDVCVRFALFGLILCVSSCENVFEWSFRELSKYNVRLLNPQVPQEALQ